MACTGDILIVEDDLLTRSALVRLLKLLGCAVTAVSTVSDAMTAVARHRFTHILLDLRLPDGCGAEVLAHVRLKRLPVKVAVLTAERTSPMMQQALRLRPDAQLLKPIRVDSLYEWLGAR